jgi:hypothetical protein
MYYLWSNNTSIIYVYLALTPFTKAFLYTTYLRPFLLYGIENYNLNANETKSIKRAESNCLKKALKLSTRIKTTELLLALKIVSTKQLKLAFFIRLTNNSYTRSIIDKILRCGNKNKITNSFVNEIFNITRSFSLDLKTIENQFALKLNQYKNKLDHEMKTNVRSHIVKYSLEQLDYHFAITDLLGFHNDSSSAQTCYPLFLIIYTSIQTLFILLFFNTTSISKKR